jgi:hypothetical protein
MHTTPYGVSNAATLAKISVRRDRTIEEQKEVSKKQYKDKMALFQAESTLGSII